MLRTEKGKKEISSWKLEKKTEEIRNTFVADGVKSTRNGGAGPIMSRGSLDNSEVVEVLKKLAGVISLKAQVKMWYM